MQDALDLVEKLSTIISKSIEALKSAPSIEEARHLLQKADELLSAVALYNVILNKEMRNDAK